MTNVRIKEIIGYENYYKYSDDEWYLKLHYNAMISIKLKQIFIE